MRLLSISLISLMITLMSFGCAMGKKSQNFYFGDYSEAEQHFANGEYEEAIAKYKAYRQKNPDGNMAVIADYYIGKSHQALGNTDEAIKHYEGIVKNHPDLVWANFSQTNLAELKAS